MLLTQIKISYVGHKLITEHENKPEINHTQTPTIEININAWNRKRYHENESSGQNRINQNAKQHRNMPLSNRKYSCDPCINLIIF